MAVGIQLNHSPGTYLGSYLRNLPFGSGECYSSGNFEPICSVGISVLERGTMPIRVDDFAEHEKTYAAHLNSQIEQISGSLMHLDKMLSAGFVDRSILDAFREAVDRVRTTGWLVQKAMDQSPEAESVPEMVLRERVRATARVLTHLAADLENRKTDDPIQGMSELAAAAQRILSTLEK